MSAIPSGIATDPYVLLREVLDERDARKTNIGIEHDFLTLDDLAKLKGSLPTANIVDISGVFRELRMVKDEEELDRMRKAAAISDAGMEAALDAIGERVTEIEVSVRAMNAMNEYWMRNYPDAEVASFGSAETWACNALWCYCLNKNGLFGCESPSSYRLRDGDKPFTVVMTAVDGYHCENERTPILGQPTDQQRKAYEVNLEAIRKILAAIRPGVACSEVAEAGARIYERYGYAEKTGARAGHSMGLSGHEEPSFALGEETLLEKNMVMSVEPGIMLDDIGVVTNSYVGIVTDNGFDLLTKYRVGELIVL